MQNDMRDRLVELFGDESCPKQIPCDICEYQDFYNCHHYARADHLIANGVILPPCKVGDKVYMIGTNIKQNYVYSGWDYVKAKPVYEIKETKKYFVYEYVVPNIEWVFVNFYNIGKTVFLTKEQAEQKLKEMRVENGNL